MAYVIASLRNDKPYSYYHSDKTFYCAVINMKGCNIRIYKSLASAKRAFNKLHFKGVGLAILEVNDGEILNEGKEVVYKFE